MQKHRYSGFTWSQACCGVAFKPGKSKSRYRNGRPQTWRSQFVDTNCASAVFGEFLAVQLYAMSFISQQGVPKFFRLQFLVLQKPRCCTNSQSVSNYGHPKIGRCGSGTVSISTHLRGNLDNFVHQLEKPGATNMCVG